MIAETETTILTNVLLKRCSYDYILGNHDNSVIFRVADKKTKKCYGTLTFFKQKDNTATLNYYGNISKEQFVEVIPHIEEQLVQHGVSKIHIETTPDKKDKMVELLDSAGFTLDYVIDNCANEDHNTSFSKGFRKVTHVYAKELQRGRV